jgi:RNA polymerase sigma-70 factor (ECF subfamily)
MAGSVIVSDELEQHRRAIGRYLRNMVRDAAEAEDLVQETFLRAFRQRATLRDDAALLGWLYQIATHVCLDRLRQRARMRSRKDDRAPEELPVEDHSAPSALNVLQQQEMSTCVQRYVTQLSDMYKTVLLLHEVDGLTAEEIAGLLGQPLTAVKMRLHRARRKLQLTLQEACAFDHDDRGVLVCDPKPNR